MTQIPAKDRILLAARRMFADKGFRATTMRAIAAEAECDVALIPHYFGSKQKLFEAAVEFPVNPQQLARNIADVPFEQLGEKIVTQALEVWESPLADQLLAVFKRQIDAPEVVGEFVDHVLWSGVLERVVAMGVSEEAARKRIGLAQMQLAGLLVARYVLKFPGVVEQSVKELVTVMAPTLQKILNGDHHG